MATEDPTWTQTIVVLAAFVVPLFYAFTHHGRARKLTLMAVVPFLLFVARAVYVTPSTALSLEGRLKRSLIFMLADPMTIAWPLFVLIVYGLIRLLTRLRRPVAPGGTEARADYYAYLQSAEWRRRREDAIRRANGRCQLCNGVGPLEVHHRTYDRLGQELPGDLTVLCRACHKTFHALRGMPVRS